MLGQFPIRDWILLFLCGWIIAHTNWPADRPVRTVVCRLESGDLKQYVLRAEDSDVAIIQKQIERWDEDAEPTALAVARWRSEIADFYCQNGRPSITSTQGEVAQVAYQPSQHFDANYWRLVRDKTNQWIASTEKSLQTRRASRGELPVKMGPVELSGVSVLGKIWSVLIGAMLATGLCLWSLTTPAIELRLEEHEATRIGLAGQEERSNRPIRIAIPMGWVRIHQPMGVKLRRAMVAVIVCGALAIQLKMIAGI